MKAIQLRLGFTLELIASLALGIALAKAFDRRIYDLPGELTPDRVVSTGFNILIGFIALNGIALGIERGMRRGPSVWGVGRYFMMCSFFPMTGSFVWFLFRQLAITGHDQPLDILNTTEVALLNAKLFIGDVSGIVLGGLLSATLARWPLRGSHTDAREILGRVILALMLMLWIAELVLQCYRNPSPF